MYVQGFHGQKAFVVEGPVRTAVCGRGDHSQLVLSELDLVLGTVLLAASGVAISAFYFIAAGQFNWVSADGLLTVTNPASAEGSGMISTGSKGTLIAALESTGRHFCTAEAPTT